MLAFLLIAVLAAGSFWVLTRGRDSHRPALAAVVAGLIGYALSGRPLLPSAPAPPAGYDLRGGTEADLARQRLLTTTGDVGAWLTLADALARSGQGERAVRVLQTALAEHPNEPDLRVGLGNALVAHAGGQVPPAARLAYAQAARMSSADPAPAYFLAQALRSAGQPSDEATVKRVLTIGG